ncbi:MAG TPA: M24 family metallopeptidase [bacterium]|nr:M24 family metallopeptidase [bacterium]HMW35534.1 M24 family metallopeptidase [bacterium]HMY34565.1 M24 family metallopeptidase [bacterium]HNB08739.1 M24 family metallopeptidase [bacterium]HND75850.1 M24 family metallopeptidase [bacterium]
MAQSTGNINERIERIQKDIARNGYDGWLLYSFRKNNPVASSILSIPEHLTQKRRFFYYIPAQGTPKKLVHGIERYVLDTLPGEKVIFSSWQDLEAGLKAITAGHKKIAMEYSPECNIPYVAIVDAGTIELVRKTTQAEIVSSADLVQYFDSTWDDQQLQLHVEAGKALTDIIPQVWGFIREKITGRQKVTEYDVQQFIHNQFIERGLTTGDLPNCSVNENAGDPHYEPTKDHCKEIHEGDLVLIDWWAKKNHPRGVYADYTQMGFVGKTVPEKFAKVFDVVVGARDAAIAFIKEEIAADRPLPGWKIDDVCRAHIVQHGYGEYFIHRTGHSIGEEVHGNGANIDNLETKDNRRIIPRTCFSIEPGIYFVGDFGVRTEVNVYVGDKKDVLVTGTPMQSSIFPILA